MGEQVKYHQHFKHIKPFAAERLRYVMRRWSTEREADRWALLHSWAILVTCDKRGYHGMRTPVTIVNPNAGTGFYLPHRNEIHMAYPSIITYLHEFRHAMQAQGFAGNFRDAEHDARGWSLSLYNKVAPRTLRRLVREGKVFHITEADMR